MSFYHCFFIQEALKDSEAWIGFDVSLDELEAFAHLAAELSMKRVVFAVRMETEQQMGENFMLNDTASILSAAGIKFTLIKYAGNFSIRNEAAFPYRIVRDALPLPQASAKNRFQTLSSDDIFRVPCRCSLIRSFCLHSMLTKHFIVGLV